MLAASDDDGRDALTQLCGAYWYPLYAYIRRRGSSSHEAQDLTQAFFSHLLEKKALEKADRDRGRFRAFLLTALKNFLANEWARTQSEKRGGGKSPLSLDFESGEARYPIEPAHELTAEKLYERRWVLTLLDQVLERLQTELSETGKADQFEQFKRALTGEANAADYERSAEVLGITPLAAKQAAYRMRKRYRQLFREEVARTIGDEGELDDEIGRLLATLAE